MSIGFTGRMARASATRPWRTVGIWVVALAGAVYAASFLGSALTQEDRLLTPTESDQVQTLVDQYRSTNAGTATETVIVTSDSARFGDASFTATLDQVVGAMGGVDGVVSVSAPTPAQPFPVSPSGYTALVTVQVEERTDGAQTALGIAINDAAASVQHDGFRVIPFGNASVGVLFDALAEKTLVQGEAIGVGIAVIILAIVFGALAAAGVPIVLGLVSITVAVGLTAVVGQAFELSFFIVNMITMMGLALSIDYTLIVVQRFREERSKGRDVLDAITVAGSTATRAVVFSGLTVIIALSGLLLVPSTLMRSLGGGAILVAFASVLAALTLLPALLRLLGDRINKGRIPTAHPGREPKCWAAIARTVIRRPWIAAGLGVAILLTLASPVLGMRLAFSGLDALPADNPARVAQDILVKDFGWGRSGTTIAIENAAGSGTAIAALAATIEADPGFAETTIDDRGAVVFVDTKDVYDSSDPRSEEAIVRLHDEIVPAALAGTGATAALGGDNWGAHEFTGIILDSTPGVMALVLGASFILLMIGFRSIVIPATGIVLNLLSTGAAYGLLVAVFQYGWGADILGMPQVDGIAPWIPLFLFAVLFGLSMDYHVFLLSRIKESYDAQGDTRIAVVQGLSRTGALITGAALIMVAVFAGFAMGDLAEFAQMGFGLGAAVIIDATLVRTILVPALMTLLGKANWYLPRWLSWLPSMSFEGRTEASREAELEPALV
jgi:putative drug exporter of the RND superfamily